MRPRILRHCVADDNRYSLDSQTAIPSYANMNIERAKGLAELANNTVATVAIGFGGAWALYTFNGELKREMPVRRLKSHRSRRCSFGRYTVVFQST